ncbi:uncharacterized protein LOC142976394 isoform X4 [Anticarsia gemmatalis]|uniref:uncharacterized protein LOC142976394 isoform X4 n=1 Tax=Anticarsia gemmatalis TaxID=129554 RepID=UPI003F7661FD
MASDEQFSLCWNNFHANMSAGFHGLLSRGDLVDVTLAAEGRLLQAHKLVLSVCSPYFQEMFKMNPTQHPIVFLKDVSHSALRDLLQFMYQGEVNVKQEELASFISTAEQLQVKGLTGNQNEESSTPSKPKPTSRPGPRSSQQRQSVMTKLETDLDSKPSSTPVAVKRPNRPSIASNNSSSSQSGPAKRKCVDPLEAGPSGSAKDEFVTIPDEDENNAVAPKMEPEFVNESMWDDDEDGANNEETNFGEDDSNMEMTGFDGSTTGDGNITGGGEGGAVGDAQDDKPKSEQNQVLATKAINELTPINVSDKSTTLPNKATALISQSDITFNEIQDNNEAVDLHPQHNQTTKEVLQSNKKTDLIEVYHTQVFDATAPINQETPFSTPEEAIEPKKLIDTETQTDQEHISQNIDTEQDHDNKGLKKSARVPSLYGLALHTLIQSGLPKDNPIQDNLTRNLLGNQAEVINRPNVGEPNLAIAGPSNVVAMEIEPNETVNRPEPNLANRPALIDVSDDEAYFNDRIRLDLRQMRLLHVIIRNLTRYLRHRETELN